MRDFIKKRLRKLCMGSIALCLLFGTAVSGVILTPTPTLAAGLQPDPGHVEDCPLPPNIARGPSVCFRQCPMGVDTPVGANPCGEWEWYHYGGADTTIFNRGFLDNAQFGYWGHNVAAMYAAIMWWNGSSWVDIGHSGCTDCHLINDVGGTQGVPFQNNDYDLSHYMAANSVWNSSGDWCMFTRLYSSLNVMSKVCGLVV